MTTAPARNPSNRWTCSRCGKKMREAAQVFDWPNSRRIFCQDCYWILIDQEMDKERTTQ